MTKYKIVVDSTADITKEEAAKYGIEIVPLKIIVDGVEFIDGVDFTQEEFLVKMAESAELPTSSQPGPGAFLETFEKIQSEGAEPITILLSHEISGTYQAGVIAGQMTDGNVHVIDSRFASLGVRVPAFEAAKMAAEGKSLEEITARINELLEQTEIYIGLKTVENLVKGGRLSKTKGAVSSFLNIKPIIKFDDGSLVAHDKVRGFPAVSKYMIDKLKSTMDVREVTHVGLLHVCNEADALKIEAEIKTFLPDIEVTIVNTSAVLSRHLGPGALALSIVSKP